MSLNINNKYFNSEQKEGVIKLHLDYSLFLEEETFEHKNTLLELLETVDSNKEIKTLIIINDYPTFFLDVYKDKWDALYESEDYESAILRVFRTYNQIFLRIKALEMVVISVSTKPVNSMLFNFNMAADIRFVDYDFYVDNDNNNMANIPKGGAIYSESNLMYINPMMLLFSTNKVFSTELLKVHMVEEVFKSEELMERVMLIANRYSQFDYIEIEAVKILEHKNLKRLERALQKENEYLLTCVRKKKNNSK